MQLEHSVATGAKSLSLSLRVLRADGTVEELGVVSYWHRNPLKRWAWKVGQWLRLRRPGTITGRSA